MALPTGTVTFLFTDIEGSTQLWEAYPEAMRFALARHDELLRVAIEQNNGYVFKTIGDAFCAAFPTALDAVNAAFEAQLALPDQEWGETGPIRVRMALHTGLVETRDYDYFGPPVNRVARLLSTAHGGQPLVSQAACDLIRDSLPAGVTLRDLGAHQLKDLAKPEQVYQLQHPNLPDNFPPIKSLSTHPTNLPAQLTSFIGREKEMVEIKSLLQKSRLVTLTGSGGTGKTRLSLQVAADVLEVFAEGVWFVELAPVSDPGLVPQTVAEALSVREQPGAPITKTLLSALKDRQMLLVLDNCEHVLDVSAHLVDAILRGCSKVKILVSSREVLGSGGESSYRVPSLSVPDLKQVQTRQSVSACESVRLFIERATSARSDFAVTEVNALSIASVCHRLDGIPLAIELAAARVRAMPVDLIESRLDSRFRLLTGGSRTALPRQQTLRALIDWSYDLLNEQEKVLLHRLAVFAGGWTLEAAEAVCAVDGAIGNGQSAVESTRHESLLPTADCLLPDEVLDLLTSLVDKSMAVYEEIDAKARYRLLETVRQYARERLLDSGENNAIRERHLGCYLSLAEEAEPKLQGSDQARWYQRLEQEHENMRAALTWSLETADENECGSLVSEPVLPNTEYRIPNTEHLALRLCGALWRFWYTRGHLAEGWQWCVRVLNETRVQEPTTERAKALNGAGALANMRGEYILAQTYHEEGLAIQRVQKNKIGIAASLNNLGAVSQAQGDHAAARAYFEESLAIKREIGNRNAIASSLNNLGNAARYVGDYGTAHTNYLESLAIQREIGDRSGIAASLHNLGIVAINQGDDATAREYYEQSLAIKREIGDRSSIAITLNNLGVLAADHGEYASARAHLEDSLAIQREIGDLNGVAMSLNNLGLVAADQGNYASARTCLEESTAIRREIGDREGTAYSLEAFASLAVKESRSDRAAALWGAAGSLREAIGSTLPPQDRERHDGGVAQLRAALGDEALSAAWENGRRMTMEEAVALALQGADV